MSNNKDTVYNTVQEMNSESTTAASIQRKIEAAITHFEKLGYHSLASEIKCMSPSSTKTFTSILSGKVKDLLGDISIDKDGSVKVDNLQISDKITGKTEPLVTKALDLLSQPSKNVLNLLGHKSIPLVGGKGAKVLLSLTKSIKGWSIEIMKYAVSVADKSASI